MDWVIPRIGIRIILTLQTTSSKALRLALRQGSALLMFAQGLPPDTSPTAGYINR